jgi:peptidyl-prolyl cis-trans isomerase B (cyclophilin B)
MQFTSFTSFLVAAAVALGFLGCEPTTDREVLIQTTEGDIKVLLYDQTPLHRDNFLKLAKEGFYDSLLFHRVIPNFMIQGGDPDSKNAAPGDRLGMGGPGYQIPAEIGAPHIKGTLAAARRGGPSNPEKKSSGSQFYIVVGQPVTASMLKGIEASKGIRYNETQKQLYLEKGGYPNLDNDYTVFGEVLEGMDVVERISKVRRGLGDRPNDDIRIKTVKVIR